MTGQIRFFVMHDAFHSDAVCRLMESLYVEDPAASGVGQRSFTATVNHLLASPHDGKIVLFIDGETVRGYSVLIPYWSNEFSGQIVFVDELYVVPDARGQGIARALFEWIEREKPYGAVAVFLEVSPANHRARRLYESLGLQERSNRTFSKRLP